MEESYEKSCWSVTVWAVALVLGAALLVSFFAGHDGGVVSVVAENL